MLFYCVEAAMLAAAAAVQATAGRASALICNGQSEEQV
jgi:hypothetical protein